MKRMGNAIRAIVSVDAARFSVELVFDDDSTRTVSLAWLFEHPRGLAAEVMRGGMFNQCRVDSGALAWPNGLELCPDALIKEQVATSPRRNRKQAGR